MLTRSWLTSRTLALSLAVALALPTLAATAGCGSKGNDASSQGGGMNAPATAPDAAPMTAPPPQKQGLSTKQKVVLLAGAALLFYLYKRDIANNNKAAAGPNGHPQLYREEKGPNTGSIYYRDPKNPQHVIWVTAPNQPVAVPADQVQQYAPDYQQYQGQPAPSVPSGATTVPATQYDPSLAGGQGQ